MGMTVWGGGGSTAMGPANATQTVPLFTPGAPQETPDYAGLSAAGIFFGPPTSPEQVLRYYENRVRFFPYGQVSFGQGKVVYPSQRQAIDMGPRGPATVGRFAPGQGNIPIAGSVNYQANPYGVASLVRSTHHINRQGNSQSILLGFTRYSVDSGMTWKRYPYATTPEIERAKHRGANDLVAWMKGGHPEPQGRWCTIL